MVNETGAHLVFLRKCYPAPPAISNGAGEGRVPAEWMAGVDAALAASLDLKSWSLSRASLLELCRDPRQDTLALCVSILAWGEMRFDNARRLFAAPRGPWLTIANQLRSGEVSRESGFSKFLELRNANRLPGMRAAYFTKLLYFLPPADQKGYIMDQWLGCSINLLRGHELVLMDETKTWKLKAGAPTPVVTSSVSDANDAARYERFCRSIETLATELGPHWSAEQAELALMSQGRGKHPWRNYVVEQRLKRFHHSTVPSENHY